MAFSPWHPTTVADQAGRPLRFGEVLDPVREKHPATMPQLAIAWLLHRSQVMRPIPGMSSPEHFQENRAGAAIDLTGEEVEDINQLMSAWDTVHRASVVTNDS